MVETRWEQVGDAAPALQYRLYIAPPSKIGATHPGYGWGEWRDVPTALVSVMAAKGGIAHNLAPLPG